MSCLLDLKNNLTPPEPDEIKRSSRGCLHHRQLSVGLWYKHVYQCILSRRWSQFPRKFRPAPMSNLVSPEEQNTNSCLHDSS